MARIRIFITLVGTQHHFKIKFHDKQTVSQEKSLSFLDIVTFLWKVKVKF